MLGNPYSRHRICIRDRDTFGPIKWCYAYRPLTLQLAWGNIPYQGVEGFTFSEQCRFPTYSSVRGTGSSTLRLFASLVGCYTIRRRISFTFVADSNSIKSSALVSIAAPLRCKIDLSEVVGVL